MGRAAADQKAVGARSCRVDLQEASHERRIYMPNDLKPSIAQAAANQAGARTGSSGSHVRGDASRRSRQRTPSSPGKPPESSALLSVGQIQQRPIAQLIPYAPNARTH